MKENKPMTRRGIIPSGIVCELIRFLAEDEAEVIAWADEHAAIYEIIGKQDRPLWEIRYIPDRDNLAPFPISYRVIEGGKIEKVPTVIEGD